MSHNLADGSRFYDVSLQNINPDLLSLSLLSCLSCWSAAASSPSFSPSVSAQHLTDCQFSSETCVFDHLPSFSSPFLFSHSIFICVHTDYWIEWNSQLQSGRNRESSSSNQSPNCWNYCWTTDPWWTVMRIVTSGCHVPLIFFAFTRKTLTDLKCTSDISTSCVIFTSRPRTTRKQDLHSNCMQTRCPGLGIRSQRLLSFRLLLLLLLHPFLFFLQLLMFLPPLLLLLFPVPRCSRTQVISSLKRRNPS